ncbi:unnamed protein product [Musa acuminata subsp. malaccensis]|uniref:(wild Malaysian banana) hypothetical protein n=1 Tax=Musa acuminata subsp. malaccensis TaxID=214687 RepID=A0A804JWY2_MUSAM|nr:PREDICTED: uncharacterized protein LOC103992096 [Musa acuminata subsp. malaccensis]CAG1856950.1 unnamed protein product [Musa acuminata subsp. malaccensis]
MDLELRAAREKLEREQRERKERAKAKLEREKRAKAEAARQRDAIEAAQRSKRLDAARAQLEAERQMEESMLRGNGIIFSHTLEAVPFNGFGDKIKLPPSCFRELSDQGALDKGPMYFRLSIINELVPLDNNATDQREHQATHSGVLEFTAREGSVELPPHVWSNLLSGVSLDVPLAEVHYVSLPKGTYAKLQTDGMGFSDIPNHKAVLETTLRRHATLSQGDIISVSYGELNYKLRVLELKPDSSVSVLETDIEVDIEGPDSALETNRSQHMLRPLVMGKTEEGIVEEGNFNYYKFSVEDAMSDKVTSGQMNVEVKIEADQSDGDTNVYVSRHPLIFPTQHRHEWSSHEMGSKVLIIRPKDPSTVAGTYSIGVFGFKGMTKYHICAALKDNVKQKIGGYATASSQIDMETVECRNCKHYISSRSILLHEAYCIRHNVLCQHNGCGVVLRKEEAANHMHCDKCGQAFQQGQMEKHMKVFHEPLHCPCGVILEKEQMVQHQSAICPLRLITCRFCGDMVQAGNTPADARDRLRGLSEHESICGSRTAPCDSCGRSIMLKEMDIHVIAVHQKS